MQDRITQKEEDIIMQKGRGKENRIIEEANRLEKNLTIQIGIIISLRKKVRKEKKQMTMEVEEEDKKKKKKIQRAKPRIKDVQMIPPKKKRVEPVEQRKRLEHAKDPEWTVVEGMSLKKEKKKKKEKDGIEIEKRRKQQGIGKKMDVSHLDNRHVPKTAVVTIRGKSEDFLYAETLR